MPTMPTMKIVAEKRQLTNYKDKRRNSNVDNGDTLKKKEILRGVRIGI